MSWSSFPQSMWQLLLAATWQSTLLAFIVLVLLRLVGRWMLPSWRVVLWAIPLLRMVMLVLPVTAFSLFQFVDRTAMRSPGVGLAPKPMGAAEVSVVHPEPMEFDLMVPSVDPSVDLSVRPSESQGIERRPATLGTTFVSLVMVVWFGGVILLALGWLRASIVLRHMLSQAEDASDSALQSIVDDACRDAGLNRRVRCVLANEPLGPAVCGLWKPRIVISKQLACELSVNDLQIVMAHEVEHIRRGDALWLTIGNLAVLLHWFNPLAYRLREVLQREIEVAVDAATIGRLGSSQVQTYGELLLYMAGRAKPSPGLVPMAAPGTHLRRRIDHLIRWRRPRRWQSLLGAALACGLALAGLSEREPMSVVAQETANRDSVQTAEPDTNERGVSGNDPSRASGEAPAIADAQQQTRRASGRVIDASGDPVSGARLFAEVYSDDLTVQRVSQTTNRQGEFSIQYPVGRKWYETYHTWVYAEGHGVRVVNMARAFADHVERDVEIRLPPLESKEFEIRLPSGAPCAGAVVRPRYVDVPNGVFEADEPTGLHTNPPAEMNFLLSRTTGEDGRVRIESIPLALLDSIEVETPAHGRQHFRQLDSTLQLANVGRIEGVLKVQSPRDYAGTKVVVITDRGGSSEAIAETELDEFGRFEVPAIARGPVTMHLVWPPDAELQPVVDDRLAVQPGETQEIAIEVAPTIPVTGRVVTADTGEPVAGARISHRYQDLDPGILRIPNYVETDEDGRYMTRLRTGGEVRRQVVGGVGIDYEYPRLEPIVIPSDAQALEVRDILIHPKRLVTGKLVDQQGRPIPSATVVLHTGSFRHVAGRTETQPDGSFAMRVRNWDRYLESLRSRWYWAILDQPAIKAAPPQYTRLSVLDDHPDALLLQRP